MSIYDTVTKLHIQIKCTPQPCMHHYFVGDRILLKDGLYLGNEGWFIVEKSKVISYGDKVYTKWGDKITLKGILSPHNIIGRVLKKKGKVIK
ncbi:hypothetical protein ES703_115769 [subsurface metagenome]